MKSIQQSADSDSRFVKSGPFRTERRFDTPQAVNFLKASGHPGRLAILRHLAAGEKSVGMLETLMETRQAAVSQQLARLRQEGLVACRRDGKAIFYRLSNSQVERFVQVLQEVFRD